MKHWMSQKRRVHTKRMGFCDVQGPGFSGGGYVDGGICCSGCNSSNEEDAKLLAAQAERAEAEIGKLAKDKEQLAQEVEKWKKDVVSLRILSENRGRENEHLNSQVLKLARDTEDLEKEIEQAKGEKAKLREQAAHQVAQLKQEIVHLENEQLREENETADALAKKAARMVAAQVREQVEAYKASDANQSPATVPVAVPVAVPVGVPVGVPGNLCDGPVWTGSRR